MVAAVTILLSLASANASSVPPLTSPPTRPQVVLAPVQTASGTELHIYPTHHDPNNTTTSINNGRPSPEPLRFVWAPNTTQPTIQGLAAVVQRTQPPTMQHAVWMTVGPPKSSAYTYESSNPAIQFQAAASVGSTVGTADGFAVAEDGALNVIVDATWAHDDNNDINVNLVLQVSKDNGTTWPPFAAGSFGSLPALTDANALYCQSHFVGKNGGGSGNVLGLFPVAAGDVLRFRVLFRYQNGGPTNANGLSLRTITRLEFTPRSQLATWPQCANGCVCI